MIIAVLLMSFIITYITEKNIADKIEPYEFEEDDEFKVGKKEKRGLALSIIAGSIYLLIFIYCIIPGLPLSGALLDKTQELYIDKLFSYDSFFSNGFVFIVTLLFVILGFFYGLGAKTIKNNRDLCEDLGHSLDGVGMILVLIFFGSTLISIFRYTNMGEIIVALFANLISKLSFMGVPLIILLFVLIALLTLLVPTSITKWNILSGSVVPICMTAGISPEFTQVLYRFAESSTVGLTPLFAYFIIYLAYLQKYNQNDKSMNLFGAIKYQVSYSIITFIALLLLVVLWYLTGLPIGIHGSSVL